MRNMRQHTAPLALLALAAFAGASTLASGQAAPPAAAPVQAQAPPPPAASAGETPSFGAQVEQVTVDVVVTDKKGEPIKDIGREALSVTEDGVPQTIVTFEAVQLPDKPSAAPPPAPRVSVNTDKDEQRGRTFVIIFDDTHLTPSRANQAKAAVSSFLETGTREGDRVSLISTAGGTWWTARMESGRQKLIDMVRRLDGRYIPDLSQERMSDFEAMRIHIYRDPLVVERVLRRWEQYGVSTVSQRQQSDTTGQAGTVEDPFVTGRASEVYYMAATRVRTTLDVVERAINGLVGARGRKSVILVSEGFIHDINIDEFKRVNQASRRANAALYFVNARGLEGMPVEMTAQFGPALPDQDVGFAFAETMDAVAGAEMLASESGGFTVRNTNDLKGGIQRIAKETQAYYLLGYISTNTARDGKFRKIQVKLANGKGLQIRARKGYFAPSDAGKSALAPKKGVDPVVQSALDSPWAVEGIPLRMTHYLGDERMLGKAAVLVTTEVDIREIEFEEKEGRSLGELQFLLVVAHRETGEFFRYDQAVNLKLQPPTRDRFNRLWFPIVRDFELKPGDYQAKIVVRDGRSKRIGTVMHDFEVPALDQFRVSTPVLSDTRQAKAPSEGLPGGPLLSLARREFPSGVDLLCQVEVYNAKKDEKTGMPVVSQGYIVRKPDGTVVTSAAPSPIRPTSLGQLSRLFGFRLTDFAPGDYEIFMTFRDEVAGRSVEMREPFKVVPALAMPVPDTGPAPNVGGQP